jgi:hypothetical protein
MSDKPAVDVVSAGNAQAAPEWEAPILETSAPETLWAVMATAPACDDPPNNSN